MRRVRGMPIMSDVMRLRLRAGKAKGRGRNQGRRRQTSKPADSKAIVTQRHERPTDFTQRRGGAANHSCVTHTVRNDMRERLRSG